jgi:hypothetical protein
VPARPGDSADWATVAKRPLGGGPLALARPDAPGSTDFLARSAAWAIHTRTPAGPNGPAPFVPRLVAAAGQVAQTSGLPPDAGDPPPDAVVSYFENFAKAGFGGLVGNAGQVFAELKGAAVGLAKSTATGLVNGALEATGLSRSAGVLLGDLEDIQNGNFAPAAFKSLLAGKLLGVVPMAQVFAAAKIELPNVANPVPPSDALKMTTTRTDTVVDNHLRWTPKINLVSGIFNTYTSGSKRTSFELDVRNRLVLDDPTRSEMAVRAELRNVTLDLLSEPSFLIIDIDRVRFSSGTGRKPDVDVDIADIQFGEALKFVEAFREFIPDGSGGFDLDVDATGIAATVSLELPKLQLGIFALQNLAIGLAVRIPFVDEPLALRANFSTRDDPFMLTISMFGGGGWFGLELTPEGVTSLELGLEFGAQMALDVGVASGSVSLTAGVYIQMGEDEAGQRTTLLEGFVRLCGELEILGVITISAEFNMSLRYISMSGGRSKVHGKATLIVEVDVVLFSKSVEVTVERTFSNKPGDPTFLDLVPPDQETDISAGSTAWDQYCDAFATVGAA